jgi:hypothetical protein
MRLPELQPAITLTSSSHWHVMEVFRRNEVPQMMWKSGRKADLRRRLHIATRDGLSRIITAREVMAGSVIPFWVAIILVCVAVIGVSFVGIFWWHRSHLPKNREPETTIEPAPRPEAYSNPQQRYEIPTLVFQRHEPESHGFFAPLYLDPPNQTNPQLEEEAKRALRAHLASRSPGKATRKSSQATVTNEEVPRRM